MTTLLSIVMGIVLAILLAVTATFTLPDQNRTIPAPGVGTPAVPALSAGHASRTVELGRVYYAQLCLSCHGVSGDGAGEWSYRVTPRPADLRALRTRQRSDRELFNIISEGLVGTPMIGWKKQLTGAQRWQVVAYLRTLAIPDRPEDAERERQHR